MQDQAAANIISTGVYPDHHVLLIMIGAISLDLITGVLKAKVSGQKRTSAGFRRSIRKISQYSSCTIGGFILINLASITKGSADIANATLIGNGLVVAIIYIEVTSIFENAYAINPGSKLARYFIRHALNILTFQFKNNPATKTTDNEKNNSGNNIQ